MANILLAGGGEAGRARLSMLLACYGHRVRREPNAGRAARAHRHEPAELLVLDLGDGAEAGGLDAVRREDDALPILALTGEPSLVAALDAGADAALVMPAPRLRLLDTVDRLLACFAAEPPAAH
jgi:DNA-binding response OmpR family regulator